ncbi:DUF3631 domain-containing protein [Streptomyces nigrescens]
MTHPSTYDNLAARIHRPHNPKAPRTENPIHRTLLTTYDDVLRLDHELDEATRAIRETDPTSAAFTSQQAVVTDLLHRRYYAGNLITTLLGTACDHVTSTDEEPDDLFEPEHEPDEEDLTRAGQEPVVLFGENGADPGEDPVSDDRVRSVDDVMPPMRQSLGTGWASFDFSRLLFNAEVAATVARLAGPAVRKGGVLAACREVFAAHGDPSALSTATLVRALRATKGSAFGTWQRDDLTARGLANVLAPYGIRPGNVRLPDGTRRKGYRREAFTDAWRLHCPDLSAGPMPATRCCPAA